MSQSKSNYLRSKFYNALLKGVAFTGPGTIYLSAHTGAPGQTGANEVAGNGYARIPVTFGADTNGAGTNSNAPQFAAPTPSNWGTITHIGLWDALTVGNFLEGDAVTSPVATSVGVPVLFPVGSISHTEL